MKKVCFVVSPIGPEESETRQESDALLWVIGQALAPYGFEVVRADQITKSAIITTEMVQLIQESALCITVLTGHNPNVFYETGRRHETGRPFIQLIRADQNLPFDVAGIRTITYSEIENMRGAAKLIEQISGFVKEFEKQGYGAAGTGASLASIGASLDRIERKIGSLGGQVTLTQTASPEIATEGSWIRKLMGNPGDQIVEALRQGDIIAAGRALTRFEQVVGGTSKLLYYAGMVASGGYEPAVEMIYRIIQDPKGPLSSQEVRIGLGGIVQSYSITDQERFGAPRLEKLVQGLLANEPSNETKAFYLNQLQKNYFGAEMLEEARRAGEQAVKYDPSESAYYVNLAMVYEKLELNAKVVDAMDSVVELPKVTAEHLQAAIQAYAKNGFNDKAALAMERLKKLPSLRA